MKKHMRKIGISVLCIVGILVLLLLLTGHFRHIVKPSQIDRIDFFTYVDNEMYIKKLTEDEISAFLTLYNLSRDVGEIDAERLYRTYGFRIYYKDGSYQDMEEGINSKWNLRDSSDENGRFLKNPMLVNYTYKLAEKYDMPNE